MRAILFSIILTFSFASLAKENKVSRSLKRAQNRVITCAFRFVEQRRGGFISLYNSRKVLEDLLKNSQDKDALKRIRKKCRRYRRSQPKVKSLSWVSLAHRFEEQRPNLPPEIAEVMKQWVWPKSTCYLAGLGIWGGTVPSCHASSSLAHCRAENGMSFMAKILVAQSDSYGLGFGAHMQFGRLNLYTHKESPQYIISSGIAGAGLMVGYGRRKKAQNKKKDFLGYVGVGLGLTSGPVQVTKVVKLFPTGFDWKGARKTLGL